MAIFLPTRDGKIKKNPGIMISSHISSLSGGPRGLAVSNDIRSSRFPRERVWERKEKKETFVLVFPFLSFDIMLSSAPLLADFLSTAGIRTQVTPMKVALAHTANHPPQEDVLLPYPVLYVWFFSTLLLLCANVFTSVTEGCCCWWWKNILGRFHWTFLSSFSQSVDVLYGSSIITTFL